MQPTRCRPSSLFGLWSIIPAALEGLVELARGADIVAVQKATAELPPSAPYSLEDGVAVIEMSGPLTKASSSLQSLVGGTSMMAVRSALRDAIADPNVQGIVLSIDSPGGTTAGTSETAQAVAAAGAVKPVAAVCSDLCASAAYWIGSQAGRMFVNDTGVVGSIGTYGTLTDSSGQAAKDGVKVHVVSSGAYKGAGVPGAPVTDEHLAAAQSTVDAMTDVFVSGVASGRGMPMDKARALATGQTWVGAQAVKAGLVDAIGGHGDAVAWVKGQGKGKPAMPPAVHPGHQVAPIKPRSDMETLDVYDPQALRAAARAMVTSGKAKDTASAMRSILGAHDLLPASAPAPVVLHRSAWLDRVAAAAEALGDKRTLAKVREEQAELRGSR